MKSKIVIVDYGVGNLHNLRRAFEHEKTSVEISDKPITLKKADAMILPGVGSFAAGMRGLKERGLIDIILKHGLSDKPILGICLGAQLLLDRGYEFGEHSGLGLLEGDVINFPPGTGEKIPHIGWNKIVPAHINEWPKTIFQGATPGFYAYFVHSYVLRPKDEKNILSITEYGSYRFCSSLRKGNIDGCQFHPEKSGVEGLKIINQFVKLSNSY